MLKIIKEQWDKNKDRLREAIRNDEKINDCGYLHLVNLAFTHIYNHDHPDDIRALDVNLQDEAKSGVTVIDDGNYQGTLLFLIPFVSYQPCENDYLMTYIGYGSCSGCDALQAIQTYSYSKPADEEQVEDFMELCKDILTNTIKPYNYGWREEDWFLPVEEEEPVLQVTTYASGDETTCVGITVEGGEGVEPVVYVPTIGYLSKSEFARYCEDQDVVMEGYVEVENLKEFLDPKNLHPETEEGICKCCPAWESAEMKKQFCTNCPGNHARERE